MATVPPDGDGCRANPKTTLSVLSSFWGPTPPPPYFQCLVTTHSQTIPVRISVNTGCEIRYMHLPEIRWPGSKLIPAGMHVDGVHVDDPTGTTTTAPSLVAVCVRPL